MCVCVCGGGGGGGGVQAQLTEKSFDNVYFLFYCSKEGGGFNGFISRTFMIF